MERSIALTHPKAKVVKNWDEDLNGVTDHSKIYCPLNRKSHQLHSHSNHSMTKENTNRDKIVKYYFRHVNRVGIYNTQLTGDLNYSGLTWTHDMFDLSVTPQSVQAEQIVRHLWKMKLTLSALSFSWILINLSWTFGVYWSEERRKSRVTRDWKPKWGIRTQPLISVLPTCKIPRGPFNHGAVDRKGMTLGVKTVSLFRKNHIELLQTNLNF